MKTVLILVLLSTSIVAFAQSDPSDERDCLRQICKLISETVFFQNQKDSINLLFPPQGTTDIYGTKMTADNRIISRLVASPFENQHKIRSKNKDVYIIEFYFALDYDQSEFIEVFWFELSTCTLYTAISNDYSAKFSIDQETYIPDEYIVYDEKLIDLLSNCGD